MYVCVCVLHIKPLFIPVDIQHTTSVRADFSILEEIQVLWSQSYATEILYVATCAVSTAVVQWAMQSHVIILLIDTTGTTYTIYEIEKRKARNKKKQSKRKQKQSRRIEREKEEKK